MHGRGARRHRRRRHRHPQRGGGSALLAYPTIVVVACFGLSIYISDLLSRYRTSAAAAEQRLRAEGRVSASLARVGRELIASLDTGELLDRLAQLTVEELGCNACQTWMRDMDGAFRVRPARATTWNRSRRCAPSSFPATAVATMVDRMRREGLMLLDAEEWRRSRSPA